MFKESFYEILFYKKVRVKKPNSNEFQYIEKKENEYKN